MAKNSLQNGSKDPNMTPSSGNFIGNSTGGSGLTVLASPGTVDGSKLEVAGRDAKEMVNSLEHIGASTSDLQNESSECEGSRYEEQPLPQVNSLGSDPRSAIKFDQGRTNNENSEYELPERSLHSTVPEYGSLYYEPPKLESLMPLDSDIRSVCWVQHDSSCSSTVSPITFYTPPRVGSDGLFTQTPESILKIAAKSFPNTPSILRKRKAEIQSSISSSKVGKADEDQTNSSRRSSHGSTCDDELNGGKTFNASPPYRLRSKRTTIFSVEKQLKFSFNREQTENDSKSGSSTAKDISLNLNNLQTSKMGVT